MNPNMAIQQLFPVFPNWSMDGQYFPMPPINDIGAIALSSFFLMF